MRMLVGGAGLFAALLRAAGCGGSESRHSEPTTSAPSSSAVVASHAPRTTPPHPKPPDPGNFTVNYQDAQSSEAVHGRELMTNAKMIEDVTQNTNDILALPYDVPVSGKECGEANAFWSPSDQAMELCYEYLDENHQLFSDAGDPDPAGSAVNVEIATFYHELGHATIDLYDLPFTGREEDVADQLSAVMLLSPGEDGKPDPDNVRIATDRGRVYKLRRGPVGPTFVRPTAHVQLRMLDLWFRSRSRRPAHRGRLTAAGSRR